MLSYCCHIFVSKKIHIMKLLACCLLLLVSLSGVLSVQFTDCSSNAKVSSVVINQCPDDGECVVETGTVANVTVQFVSRMSSVTVHVHAYASKFLIKQELPMNQPDACKSGLDCPLLEDGSYTYQGSFNVPRGVPSWTVTVQLFLETGENENIVCAKSQVTVHS